MNFRVVYLFDQKDPLSECWTFLSLLPGLDGAVALARDGLADVRDSFGATGFKVVDMAGTVFAEEFLLANEDALIS